MESLNFETLRTHYPELADLGGFAEEYVYSDPAGAVVKLRIFGQALTHAIYAHYKLPRSFETNFELLETSTFKLVVPPGILDKFHEIRKKGNPGAHPQAVTHATALSLLKEAHDLGNWWAMLALKADLEWLPAFRHPPTRPSLPPDVQKNFKEQEQLLEKLSPNWRICGSNTERSHRRILN
jgi:type I restriction enzyme R subunit